MKHILEAPVKHHPNKVLFIHTSDRTCFKQCRRKWMFSSPLQLNLEKVWPDSKLFLGSLVHEALAAVYMPKEDKTFRIEYKDAKGNVVTDRCSCTGLQDLESVFHTCGVRARKQLLASQDWQAFSDDQEVEIAELFQLGGAMMHTYKLWAARWDDLKVLATEVPFYVPIVDYRTGRATRGVYTGRVDNLVLRDGIENWIGEFKTAAQMRSEERLQFDEQWGSYVWGLEHNIIPRGSEDVRYLGVVYTELRKKAPRIPDVVYNGTRLSCNKAQDTTLDVYLESLAELEGWEGSLRELEADVRREDPDGDYVKMFDHLLAQDAAGKFVRRSWVRRSQMEIEEIGRRIFHEYQEMRHPAHVCPTPTWDCTWHCDFREVCLAMSDGVDVEAYLYGDEYRKRVGYYGDVRDEG